LSFITFSRAAILEVAQEVAPTLEIFLLTFGETQNLPIAVRADADRHQHRDVLDFPRPAALQDHAVEVQVRELARDLTDAPRLDGAGLVAPALAQRSADRLEPSDPPWLSGAPLDPVVLDLVAFAASEPGHRMAVGHGRPLALDA
jgi:hypothetical protein